MFQKARNMDMAFRQMKVYSISFVLACILVTALVTFKCYQLVRFSERRIYVLANGKVLEAYATDRNDNLMVEAKDHVKMFHHYFFTLDPDDKAIQLNISKALYLADASAKQQYDNLQEKGYYTTVISGNISQEMLMDSITINTNVYPYYFRYKGCQRIIRPTTIVTRNLITEGFLRNVTRSDNNSHGLLIERWRTLENGDIKVEQR